MKNLINRALIWAYEKGIIHGSKPDIHVLKTYEQTAKLHNAIINKDLDSIEKHIGGTLVTLIIHAEMNCLTIEQCLETALKEIEPREGEMINGLFVKQSTNN
ncbi:hypothetical protein [Thiomicrorhabdus sp.]|uniref:hypothetical protein n=1 Tax=Thiomicrorhabdus sp. TaxID=2039724 RepID=UPI003566FE6B